MDFFDAVRNRHSIRRYQTREVDGEKLNKLLETVNLAPSAGDLQGYEIILVRNASVKEALARAAYGQSPVREAPVVLVFCADRLLSASKYGKRGAELYAVQDATIAAAYCQLAATAQGLATVWIGAFDPDAAGAAIETPEHVTPVAIIPVGYPAEEPHATPRRSLGNLVRNEKF